MDKNKYEKTDFRIYELSYSEGFLSNIITLNLTQLELLKIRNALKRIHNYDLTGKIEKLIKNVDKETRDHTDFERNLPRKSNAKPYREWRDTKEY